MKLYITLFLIILSFNCFSMIRSKSESYIPRKKVSQVNKEQEVLSLMRRGIEENEIKKKILSFPNFNFNFQDISGNTLLHYSIKRDYKEIFRMLLQIKNINLNAKDVNGTTPLNIAATMKSQFYFILLLENGANPEIKSTNRNLSNYLNIPIIEHYKNISNTSTHNPNPNKTTGKNNKKCNIS